MKKHYSLIHADRVLALVRKRLGRDFGGDRVIIECWSNGREQGYYIQTYPVDLIRHAGGKAEEGAIVFAQARSSDGITVTAGTSREFNYQTHQPSEDLWANANKHFNDDREAAKYIADFILKSMEPVAAAMMKSE